VVNGIIGQGQHTLPGGSILFQQGIFFVDQNTTLHHIIYPPFHPVVGYALLGFVFDFVVETNRGDILIDDMTFVVGDAATPGQ
jgi:hypothetical protein